MDAGAKEDESVPLELREKYTVSRVLGHGACGEVRLAFKKDTCDRVAIKSIDKRKFTINGIHQIDQNISVQNEIQLMKNLNHVS